MAHESIQWTSPASRTAHPLGSHSRLRLAGNFVTSCNHYLELSQGKSHASIDYREHRSGSGRFIVDQSLAVGATCLVP